VTEPDFASPAEARVFLQELQRIMRAINASDADMEKGMMRCDANISMREIVDDPAHDRSAMQLNPKTEIKNLNSIRNVERALEYEIKRQTAVWEETGAPVTATTTRGWDDSKGATVELRSKEAAHDYRYFPEPDLLPLRVSAAWRDEIAKAMPELPDARRKRFVRDFGITPYDAEVLTTTRALADYFEGVAAAGAPAKPAANWIQVELLRQLKDAGKEITESPVPPAELAALVAKVESGEINAATGKKVFARMFETGRPAAEIIKAEGFSQVSDTGGIERWCREVIEKNPDNLAKYRSGNEGVFKFFVGQVMRASRGQANPQTVNDTLKRLLS
jgi:aspartyl-tRNA(Asn)/glutamyl-tRNA(Gln) amidotransferase subunit B